MADPGEELGTSTKYEQVKNHKDVVGGYFKIVTKVYDDNGTKMKQVTTYEIKQDINGNSMTPEIVESCQWNTYICKDTTGYYDGRPSLRDSGRQRMNCMCGTVKRSRKRRKVLCRLRIF